ncbi:MAG: hypothetical protein AAGB15_07355, partial [Pseudomonadota bacterium]
MADTGKKVEVRYGAFSCVIEGYDDPVAELRDVLGLMQRMISETPEMAQIATDFDAERVQDVLRDEGEAGAEGSPGVVVIRTSDAEKPADPVQADEPAAEAVDEAESLDVSEAIEDAVAVDLADAEEDDPATDLGGLADDAVAADTASDPEPSTIEAEPAPHEQDSGLAGRVGALAAGAAAAAGATLLRKTPDADHAEPVDPVSADDDPYEEPQEAFTDWLSRAKQNAAEADDEAAAEVAEAADDFTSGLTAMHAAADALTEDEDGVDEALAETAEAVGDTLAEPVDAVEATLATAVTAPEEQPVEPEPVEST